MAEHDKSTTSAKDIHRELALQIAGILDEKKARDIRIINVNKQTILADYFVIASGGSTTQVNSLADEVEYKLSLDGKVPSRIEGKGGGSWILMDYGSVIVHVFNREAREFYKLDKLWAEGETLPFEASKE